MLKNESSQNWMKPIPLRPAHRSDSDSIFTFSNGLRMRELSHSNRFLKQLKSQKVNWQKVNADVSMTSPKLFNDDDMEEVGADKWQVATTTGQIWKIWPM
jgi:hypothetical protein